MMQVKIEGLDSGAWDFGWPQAPNTRQFLRQVPFTECRRFASVGDAAAPAALVAAASFAEHATAFELGSGAADRFTRSAMHNRLTNCEALKDELWQSRDRFDLIVARCFLTQGLFRDMLARLATRGRIFVESPALPGDWTSVIHRWLPEGLAMGYSAQVRNGWLTVDVERVETVWESAA